MNKYLKNMNMCPTFVKLFLVIVVYLNALAFQPTLSAICGAETNFTSCVASDFTLSTCDTTTKICDCKAGYTPIPTGCTSKLIKPTVTLQYGRTNEFLPGATVKLTCSTQDTGALTFEWWKDGKAVTNTSQPEYEITGADTDKVGKFSCFVKDTDLSLVSEKSDEVEIIAVDPTKVIPKIDPTSLPDFAAPGVVLDVKCINIPYGATYKFKFDSTPDLKDTVTQDSKHKKIICVLDDNKSVNFTKKDSDEATLTQDATDITKAEIDLGTQPDLVFKSGASVTLTCLTVPRAEYMEVGSKKITYTFQDTGNTSATANSNTYTLTSSPGKVIDRDITCKAKYDINAEQTSVKVTVKFSNDYINSPNLTASGKTLKAGSRLVLTCGESQTDVTYTWTKNSATIARQNDRIIQFGSIQATDAGKFSCTATKNYYKVTSNEVLAEVMSHAPGLCVLSSTILIALVSFQIV